MKFRYKLLVFGIVAAAVSALCVLVAGGVLLRASLGERVRGRLEREAAVLGEVLALDPALLSGPGSTRARRDALGSLAPPGSSAGSGAAPGAPSAGESAGDAASDAFADWTGKALGLRVTIVGRDGRVLGDSALDVEGLAREDNHAKRPEIVSARASGSGSSTRYSATVDDDLLYVARRVDRDGSPVGYLRLAVPVREVERATGRYGEILALMSFAILLVVAIVGYAAARRFSRPIEETAAAADAIASGRRDVEIEYEGSDELGSLGSALNRMTRALSAQIGALSNEKKLRDTILQGMNEGILVVDRSRRVLLANDALRLALGLREEDPAGRPLIEVCRDLGVVEAFDAALDRGAEANETVRWTGDRVFDLSVAPLTDAEGEEVGAIGIFFDVTRLEALEKVRREFVADVSHELRTPLTSIKAFIETLLGGGLEDPSNNRRFLEIVRKHAGRMEAILDDLADLSSIETGASRLDRTRVDLGGVVADVAESLRLKAEARGVEIVLEVPPGLAVAADRRRCEQILVNLLDNAVKFNREGGRVTVRARALGPAHHAGAPLAEDGAPSWPSAGSRIAPSSPDSLPGGPRWGRVGGAEPPDAGSVDRPAGPGAPGAVEIEVEDTGVGIPAESLGRIFHRFYRVDRARSREMGGTGLGLAIVKHLMRLHGGSVRAESREGEWSRFILEFPAEPSRASAAS